MSKTTYILNYTDPQEYLPKDLGHIEFYLYTIEVKYYPDFDHEDELEKEIFLCKSTDNDGRKVLIDFLKDLNNHLDGDVVSVRIVKTDSVISDRRHYISKGGEKL